ncbi:MAG: radical SAM protein [Candidatus Nealsonbacteria bacterium]|nr:radical SAM protein [Candidatus Nealsonbacteria bacterium]
MENILLIMPPFSMKERYGRGIEKIGSCLPPLGLLYLGAALENNGFKPKILDTQLHNWTMEETIERCAGQSPDVAGLYCNTSNYRHTLELAQGIKEKLHIPIIFGGPHVTIRPLEVLSNNCVDYIVIGEGELSLVELLNGLKTKTDLRAVKGIGFKENGEAVITPRRELIRELDSLPFPARHLVPLLSYRPSPNQYKRTPMTTMMVSRGCPYNCTFCNTEAIWTRKYRIRSVQSVIKEIKHLIDNYGIKEINFWDDVWGLNREWIEEFCETILREKIDLTWSCECRVNTIARDLLEKMKKAGCRCIFFGIESLDPEILEAVNKRITIEQITQALSWTKEAGIESRANFILGLPKETPEKVRKMLKTLCKLNPDYVKFNILTPYPETALYKEIKEGKWGRMVDESYDKLTGYFATFLPEGYKSMEELQKTKKYAYMKFHFRLSYIAPKVLSIRGFEDIKRYWQGAMAILSV